MARSNRQSKILELISNKEISSQDELVSFLKAANFDITQATISRDIKELGLIKILGSDGKYKYALMDSNEKTVSNKNIALFKELVLSVGAVNNLCLIKTIKGFASGICSLVRKFNLENIMGSVFGEDTVMLILPTNEQAKQTQEFLNNYIR